MKKSILIAGLILGSATLATAATPDIFPKPQQVNLQDTYTSVQQVQVNMRKTDSTGGMWDRLPANNEGAYALEITPGCLTVWANSEVAAFYAKQTISQMLNGVEGAQNAQADPFPGLPLQAVAAQGELPLGTVIDWPDLPFRGTVEGYYGAPWSYEARLSQFDFYGRNKMNTYIYAPKDDPYHHGLGCYQPYPEDKAEEIRNLVQHARRNHVRFVWAIHPANTVKWNQNGGRTQLDALCHKLQLMYDLGVRDFGVLVDDSSGEIGRAERQVQLCNYILENFIRRHPDVNQTLIMCPTGYNRAWTNARFLQTLGTGLNPSISVMWTGDTVVHDITLNGQRWVNQHVQRPTFIWWNWPCNDFKRSRISMGRTYGLGTEPEMRSSMSGFVANPMEHAEASKVGLFGVADYTWNITGFESDHSWRAGIARLYPTCAEAMQCFCDHNSYLLPNSHGYFREESVQMHAPAQQYSQSLAANRPDSAAATALRTEFSRMEQAGRTLMDADGISALQQDIQPWITQFILAGQAGQAAMDAILSADKSTRIARFLNAVDLNAAMENTQRDEWSPNGTRYLKDTEVAMYCMTPAMQNTLRYLNNVIYAEIAGRNSVRPKFITNGGPALADSYSLSDRNLRSFWSSDRRQKAGDWYCLDFGEPTDIRNVVMVTGGPRPGDTLKKGQFEISDDGQNWTPVGEPTGGSTIVLNLEQAPVLARMVRYRITEPLQRWAAICEFSINRTLPPCTANNLAKAPGIRAFQNETHIGLSRIMEVFTMNPGEYIELEIPATLRPETLEINLENAQLDSWSTITLTLADGTTTTVRGRTVNNRLYLEREALPELPITSVKLTNTGDSPREVKLTLFRLGLPANQADIDPSTLTDSDLTTFFNNGRANMTTSLPLPPNTEKIIVVGTAECAVNGATPIETPNDHVRVFNAPTTGNRVYFIAPQQEGKYTYEVIFVHKK
ncbi:MAG: beta-N-acetylglucosaminidase domain-containing protein [Akkermansia sp.]|nr:beta-N-acetylglucosaminidase domain-containing protein [Akkermansia sp.]